MNSCIYKPTGGKCILSVFFFRLVMCKKPSVPARGGPVTWPLLGGLTVRGGGVVVPALMSTAVARLVKEPSCAFADNEGTEV